MNVYDLFMIPLESAGIRSRRKRLIPQASGKVLEIGSGTGVNIEHYVCDQIESLTLSDKKVSKTIMKKNVLCHTIESINVESLPYDDNTFDTIVHTLVFCSVGNPLNGIKELHRVLKDNGKLIFIEHVLPENLLKPVFKSINPIWRQFSDGCNLTRDYLTLISDYFDVDEVSTFMGKVFVSGIARKKI
jgi:ubiquinone/menaquinone biosynthesis C-methylase UbiE